MFFLDTYPRYYLVSADFQAHPELSLQEKTRLVIEEYQEELRAYYEKEGKNSTLGICYEPLLHYLMEKSP